MADRRISDFPTLQQAQDTDLILISSQNESYNITFATLKEGTHGDPGAGISSYTDYYAVNNSTTAPADSAFSTTVVSPTSSNRYLWGYTEITYTDLTVLTTDKHMLCVYGERGDTGLYVTNITNYYVRSANKTGVSRTGTSGWSTTVPELTSTYPYLWSYTRFTLNNSSYQYTTACVVGSLGKGFPTGGTSGQILLKNSSTDYDASWGNAPAGLPSGGSSGQVLKKNSSTNYDASWENAPSGLPSGGTSGQVLKKNSSTDYDATWGNAPSGLPPGGTTGQVLAKASASNYDMAWADVYTKSQVDAMFALQDISSQYTFTKSAGNANISTINAIRSGNYVQLSFSGSYTGQTAKAQNVITGTFSGGPLPAVDSINLGSYYDGAGSVVFLKTTGDLIVRAIGDPVGGNGYSFTMSIGFLTNS